MLQTAGIGGVHLVHQFMTVLLLATLPARGMP
jgi:hypothetical protein